MYFTICPAGHSVNFSSYLLKYRQKKVFEAFEKVQVVFKLQQSHVEERCRPCKLISGPKVSLCACICVRNRWQVLLAAFIRSVRLFSTFPRKILERHRASKTLKSSFVSLRSEIRRFTRREELAIENGTVESGRNRKIFEKGHLLARDSNFRHSRYSLSSTNSSDEILRIRRSNGISTVSTRAFCRFYNVLEN